MRVYASAKLWLDIQSLGVIPIILYINELILLDCYFYIPGWARVLHSETVSELDHRFSARQGQRHEQASEGAWDQGRRGRGGQRVHVRDAHKEGPGAERSGEGTTAAASSTATTGTSEHPTTGTDLMCECLCKCVTVCATYHCWPGAMNIECLISSSWPPYMELWKSLYW